jgi:hypothetical protein
MRILTAVILSSALIASTALAADVGPLAPGKPAGIKQAQVGTTAWVLIGAGVLTAVVIAVASDSNGKPTTGPQNIAVTTNTV